MSNRVEKALENHGKGYNCCQAVACAYADLVGVDENLIFAAGGRIRSRYGRYAVYLRSRFGSLYGGRTFKEQPQYKRTGHKMWDISCQQRDRSEIWREERFRGLQGSERDRDRQGSAVL